MVHLLEKIKVLITPIKILLLIQIQLNNRICKIKIKVNYFKINNSKVVVNPWQVYKVYSFSILTNK